MAACTATTNHLLGCVVHSALTKVGIKPLSTLTDRPHTLVDIALVRLCNDFLHVQFDEMAEVRRVARDCSVSGFINGLTGAFEYLFIDRRISWSLVIGYFALISQYIVVLYQRD